MLEDATRMTKHSINEMHKHLIPEMHKHLNSGMRKHSKNETGPTMTSKTQSPAPKGKTKPKAQAQAQPLKAARRRPVAEEIAMAVQGVQKKPRPADLAKKGDGGKGAAKRRSTVSLQAGMPAGLKELFGSLLPTIAAAQAASEPGVVRLPPSRLSYELGQLSALAQLVPFCQAGADLKNPLGRIHVVVDTGDDEILVHMQPQTLLAALQEEFKQRLPFALQELQSLSTAA